MAAANRYDVRLINFPIVRSDRLGRDPADGPLHLRRLSIFVLEYVPDAVLVAQHFVGSVADPVPGEPEVLVGVRRNRRGARLSETDLHGEYRRAR